MYPPFSKWRNRLLPAALLICAGGLILLRSGAGSRAAQSSSGELSSKESEPDFKLEVERNLVQVRVVVRDANGRTVENLTKEDFQLFDNGKPQAISHFSVETAEKGTTSSASAASAVEGEAEAKPESELSGALPRRYLALYFDDIHMPFEDISRVRSAGESYLKSALTPGDRVALFTASGQGNLDFTSDWDAVESALLRLQPRGVIPQIKPCPEVFDYQAYLIIHEHNPFAEEIATREALHCHYQDDERYLQQAQTEAESAAHRKLEEAETTTESSLRGLAEVVSRMSVLPGQRGIVLISPGFLIVWDPERVEQIVDRALRANVVINALDSKGLDAPVPGGDASEQHVFTPDRQDLMGRKLEFQLNGRTISSLTLRDLPGDTGGVYFGNNNDLVAGFKKVSELPETYYALAFSPEGLKFDGRFHTVRVKLNRFPQYNVEARRGYFAPRHSENAATREKEQIAEALFSQEDLRQIPLEVHTQFFKQDQLDATLSVLTRVDLRALAFRKLDGRNLNNLTVVTVIFDQNGNYLQGKERRIDFHLRDDSLDHLAQSGLNMRTSFAVKPGTYMVREVVRDSEGAQISGLTRTVEIPY